VNEVEEDNSRPSYQITMEETMEELSESDEWHIWKMFETKEFNKKAISKYIKKIKNNLNWEENCSPYTLLMRAYVAVFSLTFRNEVLFEIPSIPERFSISGIIEKVINYEGIEEELVNFFAPFLDICKSEKEIQNSYSNSTLEHN